jgi:hypothetical protein
MAIKVQILADGYRLHFLPQHAHNYRVRGFKPGEREVRTHNLLITVTKRTLKEAQNCCTVLLKIQGGSNMTGTNCDLFTHKSVPVIFEPPCSTGSLIREEEFKTSRHDLRCILVEINGLRKN